MPKHKPGELAKKIEEGFRRGIREALSEHKRKGQSIAVMRDGKVVKIPAKDIVIP